MRAWYCVGTALLVAAAQTPWQPSPGHTQIPIWPGAIPDAQPVKGPEVSGTVVDNATGKFKLVGGKPSIRGIWQDEQSA